MENIASTQQGALCKINVTLSVYDSRRLLQVPHLCFDGGETGGAAGSLAPQTLEARSAPTLPRSIALIGLRALDVTVTR